MEGAEDKSVKLQNLVSEQLVGCGFNEILNNSLTSASYYEGLETYKPENLVRLMNPLSNDLNVLRGTLLFGGLESNRAQRQPQECRPEVLRVRQLLSLYAGKRNPEKALAPYSEELHMGLWVTGKRVSNSWAHADEDSSVYELKAYVLNILRRLGVNFGALVFGTLSDDIYAAALSVHTRGGKLLATLGILHKKLLKMFDIENEVYYADLNWRELMKAVKNNAVTYKDISKYPAVKRDLALLLRQAGAICRNRENRLRDRQEALEARRAFRCVRRQDLEAGKKSYAVSFTLQDENATLNDKQIDKLMNKLVQNLETKLGAKLR